MRISWILIGLVPVGGVTGSNRPYTFGPRGGFWKKRPIPIKCRTHIPRYRVYGIEGSTMGTEGFLVLPIAFAYRKPYKHNELNMDYTVALPFNRLSILRFFSVSRFMTSINLGSPVSL